MFLFQSHPPCHIPPTMYLLQPGLTHVHGKLPGFVPTPDMYMYKIKTKVKKFKCFLNTLQHYPSPLQRRSYLCSLSCCWSESILYVLNGQKEHTRAFFVWTAWMWEFIPILERLGVMSQFPHLHSFVLPPTLMWVGLSINCSEVPGVDSAATSTSSSSSLGSICMGVVVGVGVVAVFRYLRSCGSSPTLTSEQVSSKDFHPSYTNWWPRATVRTNEYKDVSPTSLTCMLFNALHLYSISLTSLT